MRLALIGLVLGALAGGDYHLNQVTARCVLRPHEVEFQTLHTALNVFKVQHGRFPTNEEGLAALVSEPPGSGLQGYQPLLKELSNDLWGNPYQYRFPPQHHTGFPDIYSAGRY